MPDRRFACPTDDAQRKDFAGVLSSSYAVAPDVSATWLDIAGFDQVRALWAGDQLVGGLLRLPMGHYLAGRSVPTVGVAAVAVRLDTRRRGHASALMRAALAEMKDEGAATSVLYASNMPLYRGVGYEVAGSAFAAEIRPTVIRAQRHDLRTRALTADDDDAVAAIEAASANNGALDRGPYIRKRIRSRFGTDATGLAMVDSDGVVQGYLYVRPESAGAGRHHLVLTDIGARSPAAWRAAWSVLADLATMVDRVRFTTAPTDPFLLAQPHPLAAVRLFENWMVRVLDTPALLQGRGYGPGLAGRVDLLVDDADGFCGGRFRLDVDQGRATVRPGGDGTVRMDRLGLATISTGFRTPAQAADLGLVEGPADALALLGSLLAAPAPWMRDLF